MLIVHVKMHCLFCLVEHFTMVRKHVRSPECGKILCIKKEILIWSGKWMNLFTKSVLTIFLFVPKPVCLNTLHRHKINFVLSIMIPVGNLVGPKCTVRLDLQRCFWDRLSGFSFIIRSGYKEPEEKDIWQGKRRSKTLTHCELL